MLAAILVHQSVKAQLSWVCAFGTPQAPGSASGPGRWHEQRREAPDLPFGSGWRGTPTPKTHGTGSAHVRIRKSTVITYRKGKASFGLVLAQPLSSGQNMTATAAVPGDNTSKFSASRTAEANKK